MNALDRLEIEETVEKREGFKVTDKESANWAFRKMLAWQKEVNDNDSLAEKEIERINQWREKENQTAKDNIAFFEGLLIQYYMSEKGRDEKFKLSTPYGKVTSRKQQPKWEYDEKTLLDSLKGIGLVDLIKVKEEPNKAELKKFAKENFVLNNGRLITSDGEIVEGVLITDQTDKITVKVEEG